jgi:CHRD domain-containing protein
MKLRVLAVAVAGMLLLTAAHAQTFTAKLTGFQETAAVVSTGTGTARITINDNETISYELSYSGLQGGNVLFAHIHVGQRNVAGGVAIFFCGGGKSAATQAACPAIPGPAGTVSGTVSGTWSASDIVGPTSQGVDPTNPHNENAFARLVTAIKAGRSYANVHTTRSPGGEIRGQFVRRHDDDRDDDDD